MDINQLALALKYGISPVEEERKKGAEYLEAAKLQPNYATGLLKVSSDQTFPQNVQQNAAIQLKNFVASYWKFGENETLNNCLVFEKDDKIITINETEKQLIRENIIDLLSLCQMKSIRRLYNEIIKKIVKLDFPQKWTNFLEKIILSLSSNDERKIFGALNAFGQLSKLHEFDSGTSKKFYNDSISQIEPILINLMIPIVQNLSNENMVLIGNKILKIYYRSIQLDLSECFTKQESLEKWLFFIVTIIKHQLNDNLETKTENLNEKELEKNIYWKIKYNCFNIIYRLYHKYGYVSKKEKGKLKSLCDLINNNCSRAFLEVNIEILLRSKNFFVPSNILCLVYKLMTIMISRNANIELIEPLLETIVKDYVVLGTMITKDDIELRQESIKTYIYKQFDPTETYYVLRYSICEFVKALCEVTKKNESEQKIGNKKQSRKRNKEPLNPVYFNPIIKIFVDYLELFEAEKQKGTNPDIRIKEACLYIIQSLHRSIEK